MLGVKGARAYILYIECKGIIYVMLCILHPPKLTPQRALYIIYRVLCVKGVRVAGPIYNI